MKKIFFMLLAVVMLLSLNAKAQSGTFSLVGQRFKIVKTTLSYIGQGGDGHIWSFTVYDNDGSNQLQLYITNNSADKVSGTACRPYNEWAHVAIYQKQEYSYSYPKATIEQVNKGHYQITIIHDDFSMGYQGPLNVTDKKDKEKQKDSSGSLKKNQ